MAEDVCGMRVRRGRITLVSAALLCGLLPMATVGPSASAAGTPERSANAKRPNILLLISDDQAWSVFNPTLMPTVYSELVDKGVLFKRAYVNTSLCCPSRAQIMTGLYEHNTGVDANEIQLERPTLPMALQDAGYRTMLSGKYLNSWPCQPRAEFDRWVCTSTPNPSTTALTNPWVNVDGAWAQYHGYQPDVLASYVTDFIQDTPADQPFFVMYSPTSPHLPADDPRYDWMTVKPPRGKTFDANTMNRGTPQYARRPSLSSAEIATSDEKYQPMARATRSLDDAVGTMLASLGDRSRDTLVIYFSDNGFLYGEHRRFGKNDPWEESVKVPMVVRYPAVLPEDQSFVTNALVQNVDIAPTIADLAGLSWGADGKSFLPILKGTKHAVRPAALIEHCRGVSQGTLGCSGLTFDGGRVNTPGFEGIVTPRYKYIEFDDGSVQLLDLKQDPEELHGLPLNTRASNGRSTRASSLQRQLSTRLRNLMRPPLKTTIATGPGPSLSARVAAFTYFSPSRFSNYRCRLVRDGTPDPWRACPGEFYAVGDLADGHYVFQVEGISESGRIDKTPASREFDVATVGGPDVQITSHPVLSQASSTAAFTYASSLAGAEFQCRLALWGTEKPWAPCDPAGTSFGGLADGGYRFEVVARDPVTGELSDPAAGWFFRVDTTGPTVVFSSAPSNSTRRESAAFRFAPTEVMSGGFKCTVDHKSVGCSKGHLVLKKVKNGTHSLEVSATDRLGNVSLTAYEWTVDRSAPKVQILSGPSHVTSDPDARFDLWSNSNPGLFVCQLDDLPIMPCFTAPELNGLADGAHQLVVWAYDVAMNRSQPADYHWTVNTVGF